jgi:phospholipid/cholesterol/gamma-HCH transport system substrate-binding protein
MIFGKSRLELKVGIFVFIGLVILFTFVLLIGDFKNAVSTYPVNFTFNFINGVRNGAPVRFAGVDVGEVKEIKFLYSPEDQKDKVCVVGRVRNGIKIPTDSQIWVNTLGLLGEKYIDIMPGKNNGDFIRANQEVVGNDPVPMHEIGELARSIAQKIDSSILEIKDVAGSLKMLTKNLDDGISRIKNKEGSLGKLLYDDKIYNDLDALIVDIKDHPWKLFWKGKEKPEPKTKAPKK